MQPVSDYRAGPSPTTGAHEEQPEQHPLIRDLLRRPHRWRIWPAVAILRWLQRRLPNAPRLAFRSHPSLSFAGSEVRDLRLHDDRIDLVLNAPGLAAAGSALPASDIARIIADRHNGGALATWLDGPGDRFMHVLEDVQMRSNPAFALVAGGRVEAFALARDIVGRSAPLNAGGGGRLYAPADEEPDGALALAGLFLGPISAAGLRGLVQAFTGLPAQIVEFAGAETATARPARVGAPMGLILGTTCELPSAGVEIHIEGGTDRQAPAWARSATRRRSLHLLAIAYIGAVSPEARLFLVLDGTNVPPATLGKDTTLGGLAVLGASDGPVHLPLAP